LEEVGEELDDFGDDLEEEDFGLEPEDLEDDFPEDLDEEPWRVIGVRASRRRKRVVEIVKGGLDLCWCFVFL
jgi:hypothetical protein